MSSSRSNKSKKGSKAAKPPLTNNQKLKKQLDSLHEEMEIVEYAKVGYGNLKRKTPRRLRAARTQKRKLLEINDVAKRENSGEIAETDRLRLRGSKVAMQEGVIQESLVLFRSQQHESQKQGDMYDEDDSDQSDGNSGDEEDDDDEESSGGEDDEEGGEESDDEDDDGEEDDDEGDEEEGEYSEGEEIVGHIGVDGEEIEDGLDEDDEEEEESEEEEDESDEEEDDEDDDEDDETFTGEESIAVVVKQTRKRAAAVAAAAKQAKVAAKAAKAKKAAAAKKAAKAATTAKRPKRPRRPQTLEEKLNETNRKPLKIGRRKRNKRSMYRMRNFKSQRMVERHGEAIGAHLQGQSQLAIRKLEQLAADVPAAPQVYSSLGMIYEEMLKREQEDINSDWKKQMEVAKKAYGSYHVTALLCKKDYMAWVRAADTARDVADLYSTAMRSSPDGPDKHRAYKLHWVQEAQKDYQTADQLKPPGLDVPAKLASSHMELGNLSEALTILTDLKKQPHQTYKTWMLYADLMLRIGHECTQWNKGDEMNQNYMFRRWLRKYSRIFDWQERRLQALALALEAAAGSASTRKCIQWTMQRAKEKSQPAVNQLQLLIDDATIYDNSRWHVDTYESQQTVDAMDDEAETVLEAGGLPNSDGDGQSRRPLAAMPLLSLEDARTELLTANRAELEEFDEETKAMTEERDEEHEHFDEEDRLDERDELVKRHRKALLDLVGTHLQQETTVKEDEARVLDLGVAASCHTVFSIASELLKHCLGLEQYEGGRIVAESVSFYLKERAAMRERRLQSNLAFAERQKSTASDVLLSRETYDENDEDSASDDDGSPEYLSDDEMLSVSDGLADHFKKGILPPELQVLYALCLIASGGMDFLASKCIKAIEDLRDDTEDGIEQRMVDTDGICYPSWQVYSQAMTDPLTRIPAFSFVADLLGKTEKEKEWAAKLVPLFRSELELMRKSGIIDQALIAGNSEDLKIILRKTQVLKIVLASARLRVLSLEDRLDNADSLDASAAEEDAIACYDEIYPDFVSLWSVENVLTPSRSSVEALQIMVRAYRLLERAGVDPDARFEKIQQLVPLFAVGSDDLEVETSERPPNWKIVPLASAWQSEELRLLSIRSHNLCVANSVTNFSGWESEEFNLDLLQRKGRSNYFGITLNDGRVIGHISQDLAKGLVRVWGIVNSIVNTPIDFPARLNKASTFLTKDSHVDPVPAEDEVAMYGESNALFVLLDYARLCFERAAALEKKSADHMKLFQIGISLLLPMTQFCLLDRVWDSTIGQATASLSGVGEWRTLSGTGTPSRPDRAKPMRPLRKKQLRSVGQWHEPELSLLARIVVIPVKFILVEWKSEDSPESADAPVSEASTKQKITRQSKLHDAICHLRSCSTEHALQKASLQVTLRLIDLVPLAYNPFLVMQQAAMFASQCAKGGNLDVPFRTELPLPLECTPKRALTILVRADCLQALHFTQEATFLCSFVARTCRMHRDRLLDSDAAKWSCRWKVIGICTHTISMAIRSTICAIHPTKDAQTKALESWDDETLGELERCRADAKAMRRAVMGEEEDEEEDVYELDEAMVNISEEGDEEVGDTTDVAADDGENGGTRVAEIIVIDDDEEIYASEGAIEISATDIAAVNEIVEV